MKYLPGNFDIWKIILLFRFYGFWNWFLDKAAVSKNSNFKVTIAHIFKDVLLKVKKQFKIPRVKRWSEISSQDVMFS